MEWDQCPDDVVAQAAPTELRCATVPVPLDYADPVGEQIDLTVSRPAAADPDKRRGVLMLDPGGPGGSGLALSALWWPRGACPGLAQTWQAMLTGDEAAARGLSVVPKETADGALSPNDDALTVFLSVTRNDVAWPKDVTAYRQGVLGAGRCCARVP
ncbi:hypothetical protein [Streptomyces sp. NPDC017988]|uniref:hypothetical protein n=1 Tax=Streptomyces sp. NPDC017988 TaxID=3365025 RepID=UPI0037977DD8